jgi:hypothetical protein
MDAVIMITMSITFIALPMVLCVMLIMRFFKYREKKLETEGLKATAKAAECGAGYSQLEQRMRVLEQIVTDGGTQTAAQIDSLRNDRSLNAVVPAHKSIA